MRSNWAWMNSISRAAVVQPLGDGATITALRPFSALMILLAGVAPGLVDGVIAQTTPTGRAISIRPRAGSSAITPTDFAPCRSRSRPQRLAVVLADLVVDVADAGVGHGELGELAVARRLEDGPAGGGDELVGALLVVGVGHALRGAGALDEAGDGLGVGVASGAQRSSPAAQAGVGPRVEVKLRGMACLMSGSRCGGCFGSSRRPGPG